MAKQDVTKGIDNFKNYKTKIKDSSKKELEMFDHFYKTIKDTAISHRNVTLNNLNESKESLSNLKAEAEKLKDGVFYHDETVIVDRQEIISQTEEKVHQENRNILDYEFNQAGERIDSLDYLNKAMIQTKLNFFDQYRSQYGALIMDNDYLHDFFQEKVKEFDDVLNKYHQEILNSFSLLDNQINYMDMQISVLIQQKNDHLAIVNKFYKNEMENYLDNQLTFSIEDDPTSEAVQNMIADKINQLDAFKYHLTEQEKRVKEIIHEDYLDVYNKTLTRLLKRKGNDLVEDTTFFWHPEETIQKIKYDVLEAEEKDFVSLKLIVKKYNKAINFKKERAKCEKQARQLTKSFLKLKKEIFLEYQKESRDLVFQLEKYYRLYLELLKIDPFLAQIIGDNSTKIIKDELTFLSILQVNKEHKINVNFDIKTLKLKKKINEIENELAYHSERMMIQQDIELLEAIKDLQLFFSGHQFDSEMIMSSLNKEKYQIDRLETAVNHYMEYLVNESNLNRKFLSIITQILESDIRVQETHNIHVVEATSKIKLALKEYDILALHFNTLFENEKRFLVMQSNRLSEESKINNEFILTTFSNQMRFAGEQISIANDEYKLRVEAILTAINEERNYYFDIMENQMRKYKDQQKAIDDEYQAKLYHDSYLLTETLEKSERKTLEKQIVKNKTVHDALIAKIEETISNDKVIKDARRRLRDLDEHFEHALEDAKTLQEDTINEMTELYNTAEEKYNNLKPYLNNKVNILDPTFNKGLENIKKRHAYRLRTAQIELEDATKELLDGFLRVYFTEKPSINQALYISQIEELENERDLLKNEYENKLAKDELLYQTKMKRIESDYETLIQKIESNKNTILAKHEKNIQLKQNELETLTKNCEAKEAKATASSRLEINKLKAEYNHSIIENQKYYKDLSKSFDKILDSYYPYMKVAKNNKAIKQIVKQIEKKMDYQQKLSNKELKRNSKKMEYLTE